MPVDFSTLQRISQPLPPEDYEALTCPNCAYDVKQTLIDGFDRCPECGAPISVRLAKPTAWDDSPWAVALMFLTFLTPSLAALGALALASYLRARAIALLDPLLLIPAALAIACALVLLLYRHARHRMGERPSWGHSLLDAVAVVALNVVLWIVLLPIILFAFVA